MSGNSTNRIQRDSSSPALVQEFLVLAKDFLEVLHEDEDDDEDDDDDEDEDDE